MSKVNFRRAAIAASLAFAVSACSDRDKSLVSEPAFAEPGIHPVFVVSSQSATAATVQLQLKRVAVTERIASFQGEIAYDTTQLHLTNAAVPAQITGAWNEVHRGTVRFTGLSVSGIDSGAVLTLQFTSTKPVTAESFSLAIEEIVGADDFANLKPKLHRSPRGAVLLRAPLSR
jgi:hypothetical protein